MTSQPFAVPTLLFFIASVPLVFDFIPRNRFYGIRTALTLSDDKIWYAVNRVAAAAIMTGSLVYAVVAVILPYDKLARDNFKVFGIHLAAFAIPIVMGLLLARRTAKRFRRQASDLPVNRPGNSDPFEKPDP